MKEREEKRRGKKMSKIERGFMVFKNICIHTHDVVVGSKSFNYSCIGW